MFAPTIKAHPVIGFLNLNYSYASILFSLLHFHEPYSKVQFVQKYNVDYIYVGQLEDLYYPREGLHKFSRMAGNSLKIAYENEKVVIYEVVAASG